MNKFNKLKVSMMIMFIVLALSNVFASSDEIITEGAGSGTMSDPFFISIGSGSGRSQTFKYNSFPFYFKVSSGSGAYEVSNDNEKKEVTFRLVDNNTDRVAVLLDKVKYDNKKSWQSGVNVRSGDSSHIINPTYDIFETSSDTSNKKKLYNVAVNGSIIASRGNLFFFSDSNVVYEFGGYSNLALNKSEDNSIEAIITRLFLTVGDGLLNALRYIFGNNLSINTLIFNKFEPTRLDLYNSQVSDSEETGATGESIGGNIAYNVSKNVHNTIDAGKGINDSLRKAINEWYNKFLTFTLICYIIILLYVGIMIISATGTPRQGKAKQFFTDWVVGLIILVFVPRFGFPLIFKLNEALVTYVGKDAVNMETYFTVLERHDVISGGDSMTVAIQKLEQERNEAIAESDQIQENIDKKIEEIKNRIVADYYKFLEIRLGSEVPQSVKDTADESIHNWLKSRYDSYKTNRDNFNMTHDESIQRLISNLYTDKDYLISTEGYNYIVDNNIIDTFSNEFNNLYETNAEIEVLDADIKTLQNDILGIMRSYAGEYNRLIFAFFFLMLLFQLIGLLILYIKRLFMIAVLIGVFPIIMLFYCIDKMGDGRAQTLSLWVKEFLANVFIQAIHAVIYVVLIEAGLEVYHRDNGNWILLVTAMMLLLPAEAIMKEIFGLNSKSISRVGGIVERAAIGIGAIKSLATSGKRSNDKSISASEKRFNNRMNRNQNRADLKAERRMYNREINNRRDEGIGKTVRNVMYGAGDIAYKVGNTARKAHKTLHGARNVAGRYVRRARNIAAIGAGTVYGLAGGDVESLAKGAAIARTFSGKQGKDEKYAKELKDAYKRKANKKK